MKYLFLLLLVFVPFNSHAIDCGSSVNAYYTMPYDFQFVIPDYYPGLDQYDLRGYWQVPGYRYDGISGCTNIENSTLQQQYDARSNHSVTTASNELTIQLYLGESGCTSGYGKWERHTYILTSLVCESADPQSCYDGSVSGDETGIDCGGSCLAACVLTCPDGWPPITESNWFPEGKCFGALFPQNSLGQCPPGTAENASGGCIGIEEPLLIADTMSASEIVALGIELEDLSFQGLENVFTQDTTINAVDNGDGTTTETTVSNETITASNGMESISETTRTDVVDSNTGFILSSTITTVQVDSPDDNPDNFNWPGLFDTVPDGDYDSDITADIPEKTDGETFLDAFISSSPLISVLDNVAVTTEGAVCETPSIDVYGEPFSINLCVWEDDLAQFGVLFVIVCKMLSLLVVYRGWK